MRKFDKSKTIADGYRPIYANNAFTMVNLNASIKSMKELHGFCTCNSLPAGRIAKLQGGYYILDDDSRWQLLSGSLENVTFGTLFNKLNNLNKQVMRPTEENKQQTPEEAAEKYGKLNASGYFVEPKSKAFLDGAKWQQQRSYTEEEMKQFARNYFREVKLDMSNTAWDDLADRCFEQFKKK
jgi:hypothetical protein